MKTAWTTFTSSGVSFPTPWNFQTIDRMKESETSETTQLIKLAGEKFNDCQKKMLQFVADVQDAVAQRDAQNSVLIAQYCKENNVETSDTIGGKRYTLNVTDARGKAIKGAWKQSQMAKSDAVEPDRQSLGFIALESKGDKLENDIKSERGAMMHEASLVA